MVRRGITAIEVLIICVICAILLTIFAGAATPGDGQKIGQIVKVAREGYLRKTWEGQLVRGGFTNGSGAMGTAPFNFTIESDSLRAIAQHAMESQTEIILSYHKPMFYSPFRSESSGHFVVGIVTKDSLH